MASAAKLYTPELLALTTVLADFPLAAVEGGEAEARSPTCGSRIRCRIALDAEGSVARLGLSVQACAVGQAAAAVFAGDARGRSAADLERALAALESWLDAGAMPGWRGIEALAAARDFPGRHGAILLPWKAALAALPQAAPAR